MTNINAQPWLVEGLIPAGLTVLNGPTCTGKSFLAFDLAARVAAGLPWAGTPVTEGRAVLVTGENINFLDERALAWSYINKAHPAHFYLDAYNCYFRDHYEHGQLLTDGRAVADIIQRLPDAVRLVVFDSLGTMTLGLDGSSAKAIAQVVLNLDRVRQVTGAAVVLVTHFDDEQMAELGGKVLMSAANAFLSVKRNAEGLVVLTPEKLPAGQVGAERRWWLATTPNTRSVAPVPAPLATR